MTKEEAIQEFKKRFHTPTGFLKKAQYKETVPKLEAFIAEIYQDITICKAVVENGKAFCGVTLDCHLHDWRQDDKQFKSNVEHNISLILKDLDEKLAERYEKERSFINVGPIDIPDIETRGFNRGIDAARSLLKESPQSKGVDK